MHFFIKKSTVSLLVENVQSRLSEKQPPYMNILCFFLCSAWIFADLGAKILENSQKSLCEINLTEEVFV